MLRILFAIINRWGNFGESVCKWYESKTKHITSIKGCLLHLVFLLFALFFITSILSVVFGLIMIYLPRLLTFTILISIGISLCVIVAGMILKRINIGPWTTAMLLSVLLAVTGFSLAWMPGIVEMGNIRTNLLPHKTRFPLSMLNGIALDSNGRIYLAIEGYSRIQVYSKNGDFLKGWFVNATKGDFDIWIDDDNLLHAVAGISDSHDIFDLNGKLLERTKVSYKECERLSEKFSHMKIKDAHGNTYSIKNPTLSPRVIKVTPDGEQSLLIKDPYYFWLLRSPYPMFVFVAGGIMAVILDWKIKKKVDPVQFIKYKVS